jgi:hypothetical protein
MQTLSISDGTTTISLISTTSLHLAANGWPLQVAPPIISDLGGRGPYDDVTEQITVTAQGSSAIPDLREIVRLLDQARRWARGEDVACVKLRIRIDNSTLGSGVVLEAALLGPDGGGAGLSADWADLLIINEISSITLSMRRRGLWISSAAETTATASAVAARTTTAFTLASLPAPSPIEVALTPVVGPEPRVRGLLLVHQDTTDLRTFSASLFGAITVDDGVFTTGNTSIFTALPPGMGMGTLPPGTYAFPPALNIDYLRFTSTAAVVNDATTNLGLSLVNSLMGGFDVYLTIATALVSSSTEPWVLQIRMLGPSTAPIIVEGPPVAIEFSPSSTDQVYVVHMGYFMQRGRFHDVQLSVSRGSAPIGDFIDIAAVYVYYPRQYNAAIYLDANLQSYSTDALVTYHRPTVAPNPSADVRSPGDVLRSAANVAYGDLSIHQAPNTGTIYGTFISSSIQYVAVTQNWSVRRRSAYVVPQ